MRVDQDIFFGGLRSAWSENSSDSVDDNGTRPVLEGNECLDDVTDVCLGYGE